MHTIFSASGLLVMPFWLMMIFAPRWGATVKIVRSPLIALPAALLYSALIVPQMAGAFGELLNPQLDTIAAMLGTPAGATVGWIHFLAFDLFVGRWVFLDARERGLSPWLTSPVLFFVLMFGPLGLAVYLGLRTLRGGSSPSPV